MSQSTADLDRLIDQYVAGERDYLSFWRDFMACFNDRLTTEEAKTYELAYEAVHMGGGPSVSPAERAHGLLEDEQLRQRLRSFRDTLRGSAPA
jgi:hypothetical protein